MFRRFSMPFAVLAVLIGLLGCNSAETTTATAPNPTVPLVARTDNIITGTIILPAGGSRDLAFYVDGTAQQNTRLVGWFQSSGGDVEVFVANDSDYQTWQQGRKMTPVFNSGRTTLANLNVKLPSTLGRYHLVFSNAFSRSMTSVQAQIDLQYSVAASPTPPS